MTTAPTVSVIITTYNYADFILDAIESVLAQSRPADEIIVIDDGSTDATADLIAPYVERGVLRYIVQENQGPSEARNRGIRESSGEYLAFLDADDTWVPNKLQLQVDWLVEHPHASMVTGQMEWWHVSRNERKIVAFGAPSREVLKREIVVRNIVGNPSMVLIRRSAIETAGLYDTALRWGQDWEIFIRLARVGEVGFLQEPVIVYRWHRSNLSHERRLDQLAMNHAISRQAVAGFEPSWQRPLLRIRSWSAIEFDRARIMSSFNVSRPHLTRHAVLALLSWPFEDTAAKAAMLGRAMIGETTYRRMVASLRTGVRRIRSVGPSTPDPSA